MSAAAGKQKPAPAPDLLAAGNALAEVARGLIEAFEAWGHDVRQAHNALDRWDAAAKAAGGAL